MSRLRDRVARMGQSGQHAQAQRRHGAQGAPGAPPAGTVYASGTASPGGTPAAAPGDAPRVTGLQPVTGGTGPSEGAVKATGRGGLSVASPPGPMVMPMPAVIIGPVTGQYVSVGAVEMVPIFTADGAAIPATAPGRWAQLRAAGRP